MIQFWLVYELVLLKKIVDKKSEGEARLKIYNSNVGSSSSL